ncbi:nucleoside triphosphate pyrophosphohydrolase [Marinilabilia salmonicolor]|uniref:nucleoside triphosphate pyrophosphohydrolase n=1 Tax=Marinilabilia salmonicolor TaxID=989 RepID=UPI00029AFD15|nr:nucleoside triphosphate pyrophosphohydrolase [Marinilabilia salmonicolor]
MQEKKESFGRLLEVMDELREKCPWDREQTNESLRTLTIEETYELADAILDGSQDAIRKELGDLLLHIVFYSKIGEEKETFSIKEVIDSLIEKLIYRHPHIFGETEVKDAREVEQNWEALKLKEKDGNRSVLAGVPKSLPAMVKANRIQDKARGMGFDWEKREQVWDKVQEELEELKTEMIKNDQDAIEDEFGDLFFSLINAARLYGVNPENALERTNQKFIKRFNYLERKTIKQGIDLKKLSLAEMDEIWNEAKREEY